MARFRHKRSLVLRKSYAQHERTLIPRMLERYGDSSFYNLSKHLWRWPKEDRRIELGYLDGANVEFDYQGAEYDALFPDELTQFPRGQYLFFFSRVRSTNRQQRQRIVATSNPGGEYESWVKERWAPWLDKSHPRPAESGEIRWYRRIDSATDDYAEEEVPSTHESVTCPCEKHGRAWSRSFIRAGVKDNPFIGDEYLRNLDMLPEPLRTQLKRGDWNIGTRDNAWQVIPSAWLEAAHQRYRDRTQYSEKGRPLPPEGCSVMNALGIDVARGGKCKTVLAPGYDNWYPPLITFPGKDTPDGQAIVGQVQALATHGHQVTKETLIKVDVVGVGSSPYDHLKGNYTTAAMNGGPGSTARDKANLLGFASRRAQWYWQLREALDPVTGDDLMIAPDAELDADLTAPTWQPRSGRIAVEPKEDIEKRLGRSPDKGDGFVYSHAMPDQSRGFEAFKAVTEAHTAATVKLTSADASPSLPASKSAPRISSIAPGTIYTRGEDRCLIEGANFAGASVQVDGADVPCMVLSQSRLEFIAPEHAKGSAVVAVATASGSASTNLTYIEEAPR